MLAGCSHHFSNVATNPKMLEYISYVRSPAPGPTEGLCMGKGVGFVFFSPIDS